MSNQELLSEAKKLLQNAYVNTRIADIQKEVMMKELMINAAIQDAKDGIDLLFKIKMDKWEAKE